LSPAPGIDLCGRRKEALAVAEFDDVGVCDLAIGRPGDYFEQVPLGSDRGRRNTAEFCAGHLRLRYDVVRTVNLNIDLVRLGVTLPLTAEVAFVLLGMCHRDHPD
jgi:hypothetical protein